MTEHGAVDGDLVAQLKRIRYDLTAAQAKLTDALELAAQTPSRVSVRCPECGIGARGANALTEHLYLAHAGPVPAHWERAEERADAPDPEAVEAEA